MQYYELPSKLGVMSRVGCNGKFWLRQVMVVGLLGIASMEESGVSVDLDLFSCRILQSLRRELGEKKKRYGKERRVAVVYRIIHVMLKTTSQVA